MNIEYELDKEISGVKVPCFIPATNSIIYFIKGLDINFDKFSLRGSGHLMQRVYKECIPDEYNVIEVNANDFYMCPDNMAKVNHLVAQGVINNNKTGEYDFGIMQQEEVELDEQVLTFTFEDDNSEGKPPCLTLRRGNRYGWRQ